MSLKRLLSAEDILKEYIENCPLDSVQTVVQYVRVITLLALTNRMDVMSEKFDIVINAVSQSDKFSEDERQSLLAYAHALCSYKYIFSLDKMGRQINLAYNIFNSMSGKRVELTPFYSWNLYAPSVFALVHSYDVSLSAESDRFLRYHSMYTDMVKHGEYAYAVYMAEMKFFTGEFSEALETISEGIKGCNSPASNASLVNFLFLRAKISLYGGEYASYEDSVNSLNKLFHHTNSPEIKDMILLCMAMLSPLCGNGEYDGYSVRCMTDEQIMLNRFVAPFIYLTLAVIDFNTGDFDNVTKNYQKYYAAAKAVKNETVMIQLTLITAAAQITAGYRLLAAENIKNAIKTLARTGIYIPAAEIFVLCPALKSSVEVDNDEEREFIDRCTVLAESFGRGIEAIQTYHLSITAHLGVSLISLAEVRRFAAAHDDRRKLLKLSKGEYECCILAASKYSNSDIELILSRSDDSVKSCLKRAFDKLGIRSRNQLRQFIPTI
jgi:DNA-binding CsgD family transcriptional regulator